MIVTPHSTQLRRLLDLLNKINFGRIEGLVIRNGQPVLDPLPRIVREIKFGAEIPSSIPVNRSNLVPKRQVQELRDLMREIENGVIDHVVENNIDFIVRTNGGGISGSYF